MKSNKKLKEITDYDTYETSNMLKVSKPLTSVKDLSSKCLQNQR